MAIILMEEVLMGLDEVKASLEQAMTVLDVLVEDLSPAFGEGSYWIPGSYVTSNSMSACSNALPRCLMLCTNSKKPRYKGSFS